MYKIEFTHINRETVEVTVVRYTMTATCCEKGDLVRHGNFDLDLRLSRQSEDSPCKILQYSGRLLPSRA